MSSVTISQRASGVLSNTAAPRSFGKLWPFLRLSLNGFIVAQLFYIASSIAAIAFFQKLGVDDPLPAHLQPAEAFVNLHQAAASLIAGGFTLAAIVAYCRFYYRAARNLRLSEAKGVDADPAWAVASNFVPVVNLWTPFAAMRQIWRGSHDPYSASAQTPPLLAFWWTAWVAALLFSAAAAYAAWDAGFYGYGITDRAAYLDSLMLHVLSSVLAVAAAALMLEVSAHIRLAQHAKVLPAAQRLMFSQ